MRKRILLTLFLVFFIICVESKKSYKSSSGRGSRGSGRRTNSNPSPTSFSNPQSSAPKPTLFGWQEKPSNNHRQSNPSSHSYPSSQTGLSGNTAAKQQPSYQENVQRSGVPQQTAQRNVPQTQTNSQPSHSYPASNGMSGSGSAGYPSHGTGLSGSGSVPAQSSGAGHQVGTGVGYPQGSGMSGSGSAGYPSHGTGHRGGTGVGYPQGSGMSGSGSAGYPSHGTGHQAGTGVGYPQGSGISGAGAPPPYPGYKSGTSNGANYPSQGYGHHPPQGPPPPYSNVGGYSGYGGGHHTYNPGYGPQMPGYFGNYGKGFGGVSRGGSALTGIGIAGAGVGTILTGLALWNLARSTGRHHHTVIYDNRGQPVAVAAENGTDTAADSILKDLVNCTLTISGENSTEVLAIPCAIATSFTPEADVKDVNGEANKPDNTKCIVTVVTTAGREFATTIPCSILLSTAAENNVTEPPLIDLNAEPSLITPNDMPYQNLTTTIVPTTLYEGSETEKPEFNCSGIENGEIRDPLNPCFVVAHNLTVIPIDPTTPTTLSTDLE